MATTHTNPADLLARASRFRTGHPRYRHLESAAQDLEYALARALPYEAAAQCVEYHLVASEVVEILEAA